MSGSTNPSLADFSSDHFPFEDSVRFTADDDSMHPVGHAALDWTETNWWSFNIPERSLAGWLYTQVKSNLGICSGGAFVYGPDAWVPWEQPYFGWFSHLPLPDPLDLRNVTFRNGVRVRMIEPGMSYELGYQFRDHTDLTAELRFDGLTPPVPHVSGAPPFVGSSHYDQHGRVHGTITLHGEQIAVDCFAVRDRSWGRRPETIGQKAARLSYAFGTLSPDEMFLAFTLPVSHEPGELNAKLSSGYMVRDGKLRRLASATRRDRRDPDTGGVDEFEIEGVDTDGRELRVHGRALSRMALPSAGLCVNTLFEYTSNGQVGHGEDQDVWSDARFAAARRLERSR